MATLTGSTSFSPARSAYLRWQDGRLNFFAGDPGSPWSKWNIVPNQPPAPEPVPPTWSQATPADETRYDLRVGSTATFTLSATDVDGDLSAITRRFESANDKRTPRAAPASVTCAEPADSSGRTRVLECAISPTVTDLAILVVDAVDSFGNSAGERRYLVGGSKLEYAALGDSYSAGEGVDPYFRDGFDLVTGVQTGSVDNRCHRSSRSYATAVTIPGGERSFYQEASGDVHAGNLRGVNKYGSDLNVRTNGQVHWSFLACSGAVVANVKPEAEGGYKQSKSDGYREVHSQLSYPWVDYGTDLVTITVGGNDVGFADVLTECGKPFASSCSSSTRQADLLTLIDNQRSKLAGLYGSIKRQTFGTRFIVLGYPQLFPRSYVEKTCPALATFAGEQEMLRSLTVRLNGVIEAAARDAGVEFVDVTQAFNGHEVCGASGEWINGPSFTAKHRDPNTGVIEWQMDNESFHPDTSGQLLGYASALNNYLRLTR